MKHKTFQRMRRGGFSDSQRAFMYLTARQASKEMEQIATERAFLYMLAIPLNILVEDGMINRDNAEDYIHDVASLFLSVQDGVVSDQELADLLKEYAGIEVTADWMNRVLTKGDERNDEAGAAADPAPGQ